MSHRLSGQQKSEVPFSARPSDAVRRWQVRLSSEDPSLRQEDAPWSNNSDCFRRSTPLPSLGLGAPPDSQGIEHKRAHAIPQWHTNPTELYVRASTQKKGQW